MHLCHRKLITSIMKPLLRRITLNPECSFNVRKDTGEQVYSMWHHHPEIELFLIRGGKGIQIIGDNTTNINESCHAIMVGSFLPHTIVYNNEYSDKEVEAFVIHFDPNMFGKTFLEMPELQLIQNLLKETSYGLLIQGDSLAYMEKQMEAMYLADYPMRLFLLLQLLQKIAIDKNYEVIASAGFAGNFSSRDNTRINNIYQFTFDNFSRDISIDEVASQLKLSRESFCRYFKLKTGKTYIQFLMEVRIGYACKLLMENEKNVTEICYACGYNNASNFHHQFKMIKGKTPLQYQKEYFKTAKGVM